MARRFAHWRREGGQKKAKAGRGTTLGIGFYLALFWAFPSYSFLVQREESKQQRKIEDGSKKQVPRRNGRHLKSKACAVAEKDAQERERRQDKQFQTHPELQGREPLREVPRMEVRFARRQSDPWTCLQVVRCSRHAHSLRDTSKQWP